MVRRFGTFDIRRSIFWFQEKSKLILTKIKLLKIVVNETSHCFSLSGFGTSCSYQPNSTPNTRPINLYSTDPWHHNGWSAAIRLYFHSTLLHSKFNLVKPNVLHVWIFVPCVPDSGNYMLGNNNTFMLFPFVR